jgi:hypothetical protein
MSIEKINANLPTTDKIEDLNDMIIEVNGKVEQGKFNVNEISQLYTDLGLQRKFLRDVYLGHSLTNYTGWTHILAESGYSIWRYTLSDYAYDSVNKLYLDDKVLNFRGQAGTESASSFVYAYFYDASLSTYNDITTEAGTEGGTEFSVVEATSDYLYLGSPSKFNGAKFEFQTRGSNYTLQVEYYKSGAWTVLSTTTNSLVDNTSNFGSDGTITWTAPSDWVSTVINSKTEYWVRISTTTTPVTNAKVYYLIPYNSVPGLLALSSSQVLNEEWAWCNYGQYIYVTFRNTGTASYEGDYYIASSSSSTNKENFFIYNHAISMDYRTSSFYGDSVSTRSGVAVGNLVCITDDYSFENADADIYARRAVGVLQSSGTVRYISGLVQDVNTVGSGNIVAGNIVYLSSTAGKVTKTAPMGTGKIQQKIGMAIGDEKSGNKVDIVMQIDLYPTIL